MENIKFEVVSKITKNMFKSENLKRISKFESISPPSVFIGSKLRYPLVNVGILSPLEKEENAWVYDDAKYWAKEDFSISDVIKLRSSLLNSRFQSKVSDVRLSNKFVSIAKDVAIASRPVDLEIELKNNIVGGQKNDKILAPHGMRAGLKNARVTSNVKIHKKVDRAMNDEIKAVDGISYLYKNNFDEYSLSKILSIGALGLKKDKKIVPTRWSITATDDMIAKELLKRTRDRPLINDYKLFFGEFLGNQYLIMLFPGFWSFELFELYYPGSSWNPTDTMKASTDYEGYYGRKTYASNTVGGYYATRFPILEYLNSIKRQAGVLVIRLETPSYWAGLGVWVVRESVRKALARQELNFHAKEEFLQAVRKIGEIKFNFDSGQLFQQSKFLKEFGVQRTLGDWF